MLILSSYSSGSSAAKPVLTSSADGLTLLQEHCTECHPLSRAESKKYTAAQWKLVTHQMIEKGARVTPAEEPVIVSYLVAHFGK